MRRLERRDLPRSRRSRGLVQRHRRELRRQPLRQGSRRVREPRGRRRHRDRLLGRLRLHPRRLRRDQRPHPAHGGRGVPRGGRRLVRRGRRGLRGRLRLRPGPRRLRHQRAPRAQRNHGHGLRGRGRRGVPRCVGDLVQRGGQRLQRQLRLRRRRGRLRLRGRHQHRNRLRRRARPGEHRDERGLRHHLRRQLRRRVRSARRHRLHHVQLRRGQRHLRHGGDAVLVRAPGGQRLRRLQQQRL